ncbi:uncharacterized protein BYT42DRAFT_612236 [Radiomyces spectabilis]|uniref:uncharacterized protein n=1 Tax=Radiomyces spectabilis TaxID=64574 RepID=UPI0022200358|nr:uncharacterized protein BYT42DRAFT_612236 [Radiomyces spectabilis]KAI8384541.1 hypothetical protein BYT42DRAFT_612236 [Radiomyces spectabilis]
MSPAPSSDVPVAPSPQKPAAWPRSHGNGRSHGDCFQKLQDLINKREQEEQEQHQSDLLSAPSIVRSPSPDDRNPHGILVRRSSSMTDVPRTDSLQTSTGSDLLAPPASGLRRSRSVRFTTEPPKVFRYSKPTLSDELDSSNYDYRSSLLLKWNN